MQCTVFISDLHLAVEQPEIFALWKKFIANDVTSKNGVEALYILGDFFALWAGDDDSSPFIVETIATLRALVARGIKVYLLPGNRDFLLGDKFAQASGCILLHDPTLIDLYGKPILLTHGDILCTSDWVMRAFRALTRRSWFESFFLSLPLWLRQKIATFIRNISARTRRGAAVAVLGDKKGYKKALAVDEAEIRRLLQQHRAQRLIHGHVHCTEDLPTRIVLDEWLPQQGQALFYYMDGSYKLQIVLPTT